MTALFDRRCTIVVDALSVSGLRVAFKVDKTLRMEPNTAEIKVYNFNRDHRASMQKKGSKIVLQAGYADSIENVFVGDARTIDQTRDGPDWITHIQCGDGERSYLYSRVNESFAPGTSVKDVLKKIASTMGLNLGNSADKINAASFRGGWTQFLQGYVASGSSSVELTRLLNSAGLAWSIQDGELQVLASDRDTRSNEAVLLSPSTGLVGSPDHGSPDKHGLPSVLKVKSLLQPRIRPGTKLQVKSTSANGNYRAEKVVHQGDTHSQEWYTLIEARPL